ncbi:MAG: helix-turn-helix transcriptional regulator [Elusimicrobia bacterium]|nr:helix-turn-helix transcriptional regulator [Elusimicrobiota bacterium]
MADIYHRLGEHLRRERTRLGWTQEELGEKAGLHPSYIGQIERAQKKVSLAMVDRLAVTLEINPSALLDPQNMTYKSSTKSSALEARIGGLLRDRSPKEKMILYTTLKQLAKSIRKNK